MSKSAPDTRNRLDSNKGLKKRQPIKSLKAVKEIIIEPKLKFAPKETKGMIFKKTFGFSKSTKRAMRRVGITTPITVDGSGLNIEYAFEEYVKIRRARKLTQKIARQKKHADSVAYKRAYAKSKGSKGSKPANKVIK